MQNIFEQKIKIGISACQFGSKVRYNGKGRDMLQNLGRDRSEFIWTPVCPELTAGMGVPRACIKLSKGNGIDFWNGEAIVKNKEGKDVSSWIKKGSISCMETLERAEIDVFIFMEGSPSCGVYRTSLKNQRLGNPPGTFGALLLQKDIFLIPSVDLQSPIRWWDWKRRMVVFIWLKKQEINNEIDLKEMWKRVSYICHELSEVETSKIKHEIAKIYVSKNNQPESYSKVKKQILDLLRRPAEMEMIKKWLWKNYIHLKEREGVIVEDILEPDILRNMTHVLEEILSIEKKVREKNISFRSSPINYKPKR
ncbi:MAG: DUF523 domain-containing protein [Cetobacterium sp.]|uniref:DUF523 domain-containing protein n=1 Tax=Cetobacterium sp. TaxID=2071632 RepID=UPI002FCB0181